MMRRQLACLCSLLAALAGPLGAQSVVIDEGSFAISMAGRQIGSETFTIRRTGLGSDGTVIAHAVVTVDLDDGARELRPMLETLPPGGTASRYQVKVSGAESTELRLTLAGARYVSVMRSEMGEEEREFRAEPETRILESFVAHHYYFLRDVRPGQTVPVIEPRSRRRTTLVASEAVEEEIHLGRNRVQARRVTFSREDERRIVWFDRQGRVLRVEIPGDGYVAEREDLVG